jgi:prophage maintenance system killer protein
MKKDKEQFNKGEIAIYKPKSGLVELKVSIENETIWLTQKNMANLFDVDVRTVNEHLQNIFKTEELKETSTIRKSRIVQKEGAREVEREVNFYNLDAIISVGYRVNSQKATQFRIWATNTLREYLVKGYVVNQEKLLEKEEKFNQLQEMVSFLKNKSERKRLEGQEKEILSLLSNYSKTLTLLEKYDEGKLKKTKGSKSKFTLEYEGSLKVVSELKKELVSKKEASDMFGKEREKALEGIVKNLYQTFGGKELYKSIEEKASHVLYLIIKDHPFSDGNKRIGSFMFIYFMDRCNYLYQENGEKKINDNALTALALLIAESDPKEKDQMIALITQLIK